MAGIPDERELLTPQQLMPAVDHIICTLYGKDEHYLKATALYCFASLHSDSIDGPTKRVYAARWSDYRQGLSSRALQEVDETLSRGTAPAVLKGIFSAFSYGSSELAASCFRELYDIGRANATLLSMHPLEWARALVLHTLFGESCIAYFWIGMACQGSRYDYNSPIPRFLSMHPAGWDRYDEKEQWVLWDEQKSRSVRDEYRQQLARDVARRVLQEYGAAYTELAKQAMLPPPFKAVPEPLESLSRTALWEEIYAGFLKLSIEEISREPAYPDNWLRVSRALNGSNASEEWEVSWNGPEDFRERFMALASIAGEAFEDRPPEISGLQLWIRKLCRRIEQTQTTDEPYRWGDYYKLVKEDDKVSIPRICESSACFSQSVLCATVGLEECEGISVSRAPAGVSSPPSESSEAPARGANVTETEKVRKSVESRRSSWASVNDKLRDPERFRVLTVQEAAEACRRSKSTIYRWLDEGKLRPAAVSGMIPTKLVLELLEGENEEDT